MIPALLARRRLAPADAVAAAYAAAYVVWVFLHEPGTPLNDLIADLSFVPLGLIVGWAQLRNASLGTLDRGTRLAWSLLTASSACLWISGSAFTYYVHLVGPQATPAWIDGLEYLQLSLTVLASLAFPGRPVRREARARFGLDVALTVVGGFVLAVHYGMAVAAPAGPGAWLTTPALRTAFNWAVFVALSIGVFHKRDRTARVALAYLLGANVAVIVGNWIFSFDPGYRSGDPVDLLWFAAWALKWTATRAAWHRYRQTPGTDAHDAEDPRGTTFPYLIVGSALVLLIREAVTGDLGSIWFLSWSSGSMAGLLVLRQVTELQEHRRLFAARLDQDAWFRSLVQHASDFILVLDRHGAITYVSPAVARVLGDGVVETGHRIADLVHEDDAGLFGPLAEGGLDAGLRVSCRMQTAAGDWREVEMVATDLRHDAAVQGVVLNGRDVTERNDLERQLRHTQKLDAVGHLAGGLAHDFNNVLTTIRGYTELLRGDIPPGSAAASDLGYIEQAVDRAAAVTKKLLAFSRRQAVQFTVLDLGVTLTDVEPLLRQLVTDRISVRIETTPGLWPVKADQGQVEQVVINLATNARDAMPDGGELWLTVRNQTVTGGVPPAVPSGEYVALVVSDTGTGMPDDVQARIFEPFFTTKPKDRGIGLGLAMVHGIVASSGGAVTVDSGPGRGSTFTVLLPRTRDTAPASPSPPDPVAGAPPRARRILLVDDESGVRAVGRRMLERAGYAVTDVPGGAEALAVLARGAQIDLLVTDMVMPGMHGRDLIARVRVLRPTLPIVCITGFAGEATDARGPGDGIVTVVTKPFSAEVLLRAVAASCADRLS